MDASGHVYGASACLSDLTWQLSVAARQVRHVPGGWRGRAHAFGYQGCERTEMVACVDAHMPTAKQRAEEFGDKRSMRQLLALSTKPRRCGGFSRDCSAPCQAEAKRFQRSAQRIGDRLAGASKPSR